jgi:hypothetical protein
LGTAVQLAVKPVSVGRVAVPTIGTSRVVCAFANIATKITRSNNVIFLMIIVFKIVINFIID